MVAVRNDYPIIQVDKRTLKPRAAYVFSTLIANSDYWQVKLDEYGTGKSSIVTQSVPVKYGRLTSELRSALTCFKRPENTILAPLT